MIAAREFKFTQKEEGGGGGGGVRTWVYIDG